MWPIGHIVEKGHTSTDSAILNPLKEKEATLKMARCLIERKRLAFKFNSVSPPHFLRHPFQVCLARSFDVKMLNSEKLFK